MRRNPLSIRYCSPGINGNNSRSNFEGKVYRRPVSDSSDSPGQIRGSAVRGAVRRTRRREFNAAPSVNSGIAEQQVGNAANIVA